MFSGLKYASDRAAVPARSASYRLVRLQKCLQFAAESRATPRWKPNPDEENRLYRKTVEGVSAHGLSFGRPRTLDLSNSPWRSRRPLEAPPSDDAALRQSGPASALSKIKAGKLELNPQTVQLAPLIKDVIDTAGQLPSRTRTASSLTPKRTSAH
jgi:hypothetical protein